MAEFAVGSTFADHVIRGVAGRGGMGVVYRAIHLPLKREVALKVIAPEVSTDTEFRARFRQEFEAAASIQHPNVIPIYHAGEEDGLLYVTMRFVQGTDLARLLALEGRLAPERAARLTAQIAQALDAAHRLGIVHRDVKPGNVLLEGDGGHEHAVLTDFGLTKRLQAERQLTQAGSFLGTLDYAAPEQFQGDNVDARIDVYALGGLLYQMLVGTVPYPLDSDAAKMYAHIASPPPSLAAAAPGLSPVLEEVVARAMAKLPDDRYQTAGDLGRAVLAAVELGPATVVERSVAAGPAAPDAPPERIPLPPALTVESGHGPFVGRQESLDALRARWERAQAGERQFVVLSGEPGIGKTRIATELAREAHADGATILFGRSDVESLVPYQPFITAVQHRIAYRDTLSFPGELALELSELGRFVPALRRYLPNVREAPAEEPEAQRYRLFEAVTRLLAFIADENPLMLILDDLQWADSSTVLLLGHVLQDPEPMRLMVLATSRESGEVRSDELPELLARLRRTTGFERRSLGGLDTDETEAFIAAHSPDGDVSGSFVRRLHEGTDGNPFFLEETLRSLAEVQAADEMEAALSRIAVPEGVKEVIGRRLARLGDSASQLLTVASVVGREFRLELLEALTDEPADRIITALEEAGEAGLVREVEEDVDRFLFAHALVRETLYEGQSASRRVRLHHRIGEALRAGGNGTNPAELAHHFFESRHLDREGLAIDYAVRAAEQATTALAYEEAVGHYRRALGALEAREPLDVTRVGELLLALGNVEDRAGDPAARATFRRAAELERELGDAEAFARAALGFAGRHAEAGIIDRRGIALLEEALAGLGTQESALVVHVLARLADSLHFAAEADRTMSLSRAALELAQKLDDAEALVVALQSRHAALLNIEYLDERLRISAEMLALANRVGARELEALAHHWRIYDLLETGDIAGAQSEHAALVALAAALRQPLYRHFAVSWEVVWAQTTDRVGEIERLADLAHELGKRAQARDADLIHASQILALRFREGRLQENTAVIEEMVRRNPAIVAWRTVLPLAHLLSGNIEAGAAEFERFAADDFASVPRDMFWFPTIAMLSDACGLLRDAARARILYAMLLPYRNRFVQDVVATTFGTAEYFLGVLAGAMGEFDSAAAHLEASLELNAAAGLKPLVRIIHFRYAEVLLARGTPADVARASELLRELVVQAEAAGLVEMAAGARARLDQLASLA